MKDKATFLDRRDFLAGGFCTLTASTLASGGSFYPAVVSPEPAPGDWPRYGHDRHNTRFNPHERTIGKDNVDRLRVKWKFDLDVPIETTPTVIGDTLYFGAPGAYYALDTLTGQMKWKFEINEGTTIRRGIQYYNGYLFSGDWAGTVTCLDASSGELIWQREDLAKPAGENFNRGRISCACLAFDDRVYVGTVGNKNRIVCLNAANGTTCWEYWVTGENDFGKGGAIWTSPALDEQEKILYVATGSNKFPGGHDPVLFTESVLAFDARTGYLRWFYQVRPNDPHDLDWSAHPVIFDAEAPPRKSGSVRQCLAAGNKDGFYCFDRYTGELFWRVQLTQKYHYGGPNVDQISVAYNKVYVVSNAATQLIGKPPISVTAALDGYTGKIVWWTYNPEGIIQGGIAVANGILYQGFNNGRMEALDADSGRVLWEHMLPSARRGGFAIANGALFCSNGIPGALQEGGGPGINPREIIERARRASAYSVYCFTVDGK